jgi:hypothetical protein
MQMRLYDIIPLLQPYIKSICSMQADETGSALPSFRVLPDTCAELFINYRQSPLAHIPGKTHADNNQSFLVSRMSHYMDVQMEAGVGCITVCFYPGTAHHFFSIPMNETSDKVIALQYLWKNAAEIEEKIGNAESNTERVTIIQQYLLNRIYATKKNSD